MYDKMISSSFVSESSKAIFSLFYTVDVLEQIQTKALLPFNLSPPQMEILKVLYFSQDSTINQDELGHCLFSSKANISSHLSKLESKKLISRKENPNNKRMKLIELTKNGENLLFKIADEYSPDLMDKVLSKKESRDMINSLKKVRVNLLKIEKEKIKNV